jgi:hypothetical protein
MWHNNAWVWSQIIILTPPSRCRPETILHVFGSKWTILNFNWFVSGTPNCYWSTGMMNVGDSRIRVYSVSKLVLVCTTLELSWFLIEFSQLLQAVTYEILPMEDVCWCIKSVPRVRPTIINGLRDFYIWDVLLQVCLTECQIVLSFRSEIISYLRFSITFMK